MRRMRRRQQGRSKAIMEHATTKCTTSEGRSETRNFSAPEPTALESLLQMPATAICSTSTSPVPYMLRAEDAGQGSADHNTLKRGPPLQRSQPEKTLVNAKATVVKRARNCIQET